MALGVAGGDQAAHRVTHEEDREVGVSARGPADRAVEVVHDGIEVDDQRRLAVRAPMADVVQAMDGGPACHEGVGHVVVAADVLAVAVGDHHEVARVLALPRPHVQRSRVSAQRHARAP